MSMLGFVVALVFAVAVGMAFCSQRRYEENIKLHKLKPGRKTYLVEPLLLPMIIGEFALIALVIGINSAGGTRLAAACAALFLYIGIYYIVLLCVLPLLRRVISAHACATLWLLPNLLYCTVYFDGFVSKPRLLITLPRQWLFLFMALWAAGFVCVQLWQVLSHLRYRSILLRDAEPVTDQELLSQWGYEQRQHEVKHPIPILRSGQVVTPVTIGCFERTMRLMLPQQRYSKEELLLIFRHELRHIQRCDARVKAFLGFCTAMCWFNPLMWVARRKVSDDLELSCDEAVLGGCDGNTRRQYAELLLKSAGDSRGYTTCLSAAANSLRYRLKNVVTPRKRFSGAVVLGVAMLLIFLGSGSVAVADSGGTVSKLVFGKAPKGIVLTRIAADSWDENRSEPQAIYAWKEAALTEYLSALRVKEVYAGRYPEGDGRCLYLDYAERKNEETVSLTRFALRDGILQVNIPYDESGDILFLLQDKVDWSYVESLLDFSAVNPDPAPQPPEMMMDFDDTLNTDEQLMYATKRIVAVSSKGVAQAVDPNRGDSGVGGVFGSAVTQVKLHFSYEPSGEYRITVENWGRTERYEISSEKLTDHILPLAPYSAHYTVTGKFATVRETVYDMEFVFDVQLPE